MEIPKGLKDAVIENRLVFFIGAGLSSCLGFPDWTTLTKKIIQNLSANRTETNYKDFEKILDNGYMSPIEVLDVLKKLSIHNDGYIRKFLKKEIGERKINSEFLSNYKILGNIGSRFITTNYDKVIESAFPDFPVAINNRNSELASSLSRICYIIKAHGCITDVKDCLLYSDDYEQAYNEKSSILYVLKSIFTRDIVLFIGFGMTDPYVCSLLDGIDSAFESNQEKHFLLVVKKQEKEFGFCEQLYLTSWEELPAFLRNLEKIKNEKKTEPLLTPNDITTQLAGGQGSFLRRRCRVIPRGTSDIFKEFMNGFCSGKIVPAQRQKDDREVIQHLDHFEKILATAAHCEYLGNTEAMEKVLTAQPPFTDIEQEACRRLYLAIAKEKLAHPEEQATMSKLESARENLLWILKFSTARNFHLAAQFNLALCEEKSGNYELCHYERFFDVTTELVGVERLRDKAVCNHLISSIRNGTPFHEYDLLKASLEYEYENFPVGYTKTFLMRNLLEEEPLSKDDCNLILERCRNGIDKNSFVAILSALAAQAVHQPEIISIIKCERDSLSVKEEVFTVMKHLRKLDHLLGSVVGGVD